MNSGIDDQPTDDRPLTLEHFKWPYLCNGSSDPLHVCTTTMLCQLALYITVDT